MRRFSTLLIGLAARCIEAAPAQDTGVDAVLPVPEVIPKEIPPANLDHLANAQPIATLEHLQWCKSEPGKEDVLCDLIADLLEEKEGEVAIGTNYFKHLDADLDRLLAHGYEPTLAAFEKASIIEKIEWQLHYLQRLPGIAGETAHLAKKAVGGHASYFTPQRVVSQFLGTVMPIYKHRFAMSNDLAHGKRKMESVLMPADSNETVVVVSRYCEKHAHDDMLCEMTMNERARFYDMKATGDKSFRTAVTAPWRFGT